MRHLPVLGPSLTSSISSAAARDAAPEPEDAVRPTGGARTDVPREKRVCFEVFGCQMNKLDAELMMSLLLDAGYVFTDKPQEAGVIIYNTCAVRAHAEERVFSKLGALKSLKRRHPDLVIGVLGCSAQNHGTAIFERYPHVGIVCGTGEFQRLPELIEAARRDGRATALSLEPEPQPARTKNLGPTPFQAYVSVMRGCDQACTFCVVPRTRGREISRPVREIVDECRALVDGGVREVTLLGQTVNSYGKRLAKGHAIGLQHVLHELDRIPGLDRIRFITSHPRFMSKALIDAMANAEKVCEYLHLPVQSGSDAVLGRMLRTYTRDRYREVVSACREKVPGLGLATDIIVGFSGETDAEFGETIELLEEIRFQSAFVFKYSEREGTRAAEIHADDVPEAVKRERNQIALRTVGRISREVNRESVGQVEEVLVEGRSKLDPGRLTGRNRRFQIVVFPGTSREKLEGKLVPVRITDATHLVLVGQRAGEGR